MRSSFKTDQMKATEKPDIWKKKQNSTWHFQDIEKNWTGNCCHHFFYQYFISDTAVCDIITFFISESGSYCEEAFVCGCYAHHDILSKYILFIVNFLRCHKLNSWSVIEALWWSNLQQDLYSWCEFESRALYSLDKIICSTHSVFWSRRVLFCLFNAVFFESKSYVTLIGRCYIFHAPVCLGNLMKVMPAFFFFSSLGFYRWYVKSWDRRLCCIS